MTVRSPYDFKLNPCDLCTAPARRSTGYCQLIFFENCKSADYYKIVEATEIVGSRRIVGTS